jgi:hypothetical protein
MSMQTVFPSSLLKKALAADAVVSGAVALLQVSMPDALSRLLMLPRGLIVETGAFLVAYTVLLIVLTRSARLWPVLVTVVVLGNVAWAAGCATLLGASLVQPGPLGMAYVAVQAVAVLVFAGLEYLGLRDSEPAPAASAVRT